MVFVINFWNCLRVIFLIDLSASIEGLRYPGSGLRVRVASFSFRFLLMSAFLPVISTRFPAVNHDLHVNVKRVNLEKEYGEACKYFNDFITHKISDKKSLLQDIYFHFVLCRLLGINSCDFVWFENLYLQYLLQSLFVLVLSQTYKR